MPDEPPIPSEPPTQTTPAYEHSPLWDAVLNAIRRCIQIHGPIDRRTTGSAVKRIVEAIWDLKERQEEGTHEYELNKMLADTMGVFAAAEVGSLKVKNRKLREELKKLKKLRDPEIKELKKQYGLLKYENNNLKQSLAALEKKKYDYTVVVQENAEKNKRAREESERRLQRIYELNRQVEDLTELMVLNGLKRHFQRPKGGTL